MCACADYARVMNFSRRDIDASGSWKFGFAYANGDSFRKKKFVVAASSE